MRMEAARSTRGAWPSPAKPGLVAGRWMGLALPLLALVLMLLPSTAHAQTITSVTPTRQRVHELLTITGSGFGSFQPGTDRIELTDGTVTIAAGAPYVWRDGFVQVRVPAGGLVAGVPTPLPTGALQVRVVKGAATSNAGSFQVLAGLDGFLPPFLELTQIGPGQTDVSTVLGNPNLNLARTKDGEVGDVDGDGLPDLVDNNSNNQTNGTHSVLRRNQGNGTFSAIALEPNEAGEVGDFATVIPPGGIVVADDTIYDADLVDLDNDELPELVQGLRTRRIRVLRNHHLGIPGRFVEDTAAWLPSPQPFQGEPDDIAHTDVDHDGFVDVAIAQRDYRFATLLLNRPSGQSGRTFLAQDLSIGSGSVHDVFFLDANADGYRDLVAVNESGPSTLFLSQAGAFSAGQMIAGSANDFSGEAADLNGDGLDDFALVGEDGGAHAYLNSPTAPGGFSVVDLSVGGDASLYDVELGDLDLDGDVDIVLARITPVAANAAVILLDDGNGGFQNVTPPPLGAAAMLPTIGAFQRLSADLLDLDGDGDLDLYLMGADGQELLGVDGKPLFPGFGRVPNQLFGNQLLRPGACDVNGDGRIDAADVLLVARIAGGSLSPPDEMLQRADVAPANRRPTNGVVDAADVLIVARAAKGDPIAVCSPAAVVP